MSRDLSATSWDCFDLQTAKTLFWKRVPFVFKAPDREDGHEFFTVRILSGVTKTNHNLRVLRVHVSSDVDYLFLHTLEVSEEEFQRLKADQGILVDFATFPSKLMTLLEKCIASEDGAFEAELLATGSSSQFRISETNDFNKLAHVSLQFRPGNDAAIKAFLAYRLGEVTEQTNALRKELAASQACCCRLRDEAQEKEGQWKTLKEKSERCRLEADAEKKRLALDAEERISEAKDAVKAQLEKEKSEIEEKLMAQATTLMERYRESEDENQRLRDEKYEADRESAELRHRCAALEGQLSHLHQSHEELKTADAQGTTEKQRLIVDLSQARAEISALTEKVGAAENVSALQKKRVADLEETKGHLEKLCEELKSTSLTHEKSGTLQSQELKEAKFVIQKLARDLHMAKEKHCHMRAILTRQEDEVSHQSRQLLAAKEERATLEQQLETSKSENSTLKCEMGQMSKKLQDSAEQLRENESMIAWLHRQINDVSSHRGKPFFRAAQNFPFASRRDDRSSNTPPQP